MKVLLDKYPLGTLKGQRTAGRYVDGILYDNLQILVKAIVKDMTFLSFIYSSTLEVGTGKSTFASQLGEIWTDLVNKKHNLNLKFDMNNIVFRPQDLINRAFKLPKYSCIILDEWEDLHYMSELGISLRQFFRKCRQLNLFMICIIPNFFQLPLSYAVGRSVCAFDVTFENEFERGYFKFYNMGKKKKLYIQGKKFHDYDVVNPDFFGRFTDGYGVDESEYRKRKLKDLEEAEENYKPLTEKQIIIKTFRKVKANIPDISIKKLAEGFGVSERTGNRWLSEEYNDLNLKTADDKDTETQIIIQPIESKNNFENDEPLGEEYD